MEHPDNDPNPLYLEFNFDANYDLNYPHHQRIGPSTINNVGGVQLPAYLEANNAQYRPDANNSAYEAQQQYRIDAPTPAEHQLHHHQQQQYAAGGYQQRQSTILETASGQQHAFVHQQMLVAENLNPHLQQPAATTTTTSISGSNNNNMMMVSNYLVDSHQHEKAAAAVIERIIRSTPRMAKQPVIVNRFAAETRTIGQQTRAFRRKETHRNMLQLYDDDYAFGGIIVDEIESVLAEMENSSNESDAQVNVVPAISMPAAEEETMMMDLSSVLGSSAVETATNLKRTYADMNWTPVRPSKRLLEKSWLTKSKKRLLTSIDTHEDDV